METRQIANVPVLSSSYTSPSARIERVVFSIEADFTGTLIGNVSLQTNGGGTNWETLDTKAIDVQGGCPYAMWNLSDLGTPYYRLVWEHTSGTGSLNAIYNGKR